MTRVSTESFKLLPLHDSIIFPFVLKKTGLHSESLTHMVVGVVKHLATLQG